MPLSNRQETIGQESQPEVRTGISLTPQNLTEDAWNDWQENSEPELPELELVERKKREVLSADSEFELRDFGDGEYVASISGPPQFKQQDQPPEKDQSADQEEDAWDDWEESESFETKSRDEELPDQEPPLFQSQSKITTIEEVDYDDEVASDKEVVDDTVVPIEKHHLERSKEVEDLTTEPEEETWCEDEETNQENNESDNSSDNEPIENEPPEDLKTNDEKDGWDDFDFDNEEPVEEPVSEEPVVLKQASTVSSTPFPTNPSQSEFVPEQAIPNVFDRLEKKNQWNWKTNWGVSLLANASKNVASLTAQVSQNLTNVLDTGIVPAPEEMAKIVRTEEARIRKDSVSKQDDPVERKLSTSSDEKLKPQPIVENILPSRKISSTSLKVSDKESNASRKSSVASSIKSGSSQIEDHTDQDVEGWDDDSWGEPEPVLQPTQKPIESRTNPLKSLTTKKIIGLDHIVSGVTQIGSKVITGGLDTLEGIGKKTITIIQDNDSGLINKTKQLVLDKDKKVLTDFLNEAKIENADPEPQHKLKLPDFEIMFDDHQGLVYLEALKLLSKQSEIKIGMLLEPLEGVAYDKIKGTIDEVGQLYQMPDLNEIDNSGDHTVAQLEDRLMFAVRDLEFEFKIGDLADTWKQVLIYLTRQSSKAEATELYERALDEIAKFSAQAIGKLQKLAEILSVCEYHSTANEIDALNR